MSKKHELAEWPNSTANEESPIISDTKSECSYDELIVCETPTFYSLPDINMNATFLSCTF